MLNVRISGTDRLNRRLINVFNKQKIEQALEKGALRVERDAKQIVRVDTGRLKSSINVVKPKALERAIGTNVSYGPAQEFGMTARPGYGYTPYLRPALRKNKQAIINEVKEAMKP